MAASSSTFITAIKENLSECRASSIECLEAGLATRVFDKFPHLMPPTQFIKLKNEFQRILQQKTFIVDPETGIAMPDEKNCKAIMALQDEILQTGYHELFSENGRIKPAIISLLAWEKYASKLNSCDVFCAYIGVVNAQIIKSLEGVINKNITTYNGVCCFTNKNYRKWAETLFEQHGKSFTPSTIIKLITEKSVKTSVAVAVIGVALYAMFRLFTAESKFDGVGSSNPGAAPSFTRK